MKLLTFLFAILAISTITAEASPSIVTFSEYHQISNFATVLEPGGSYVVKIKKNVDVADFGYTPGFWGDLERVMWDWTGKMLRVDLSIQSAPITGTYDRLNPFNSNWFKSVQSVVQSVVDPVVDPVVYPLVDPVVDPGVDPVVPPKKGNHGENYNLTVCFFPEKQIKFYPFNRYLNSNPYEMTFDLDFTPAAHEPSCPTLVNPFVDFWCMTHSIEALNMCFPAEPIGSIQFWNPSDKTVPIMGYVKTYLNTD